MNATARTTNAERAGRWLGRAWRGFVRQEARASRWLGSHGVPASVARVLLWIAKLAVLGIALYAMSWAALPFVVVLAVAWLARHADWDGGHPEPEWRNGLAGFGFYTYDEHRIDPHVQDDDDQASL